MARHRRGDEFEPLAEPERRIIAREIVGDVGDDLAAVDRAEHRRGCAHHDRGGTETFEFDAERGELRRGGFEPRSEEHTSELQSLMRTSYAVFCLKKKK